MKRAQDNRHRNSFKRNRARALRLTMTEAERRLWNLLRKRQMAGLRFRRQQPIGPYVADFYCSAVKLIVELDGAQHTEDAHLLKDAIRTRWLAGNGYRVLRFTNVEFLRDPACVLETIWRAMDESGCPLPEAAAAASTLPHGEGGT